MKVIEAIRAKFGYTGTDPVEALKTAYVGMGLHADLAEKKAKERAGFNLDREVVAGSYNIPKNESGEILIAGPIVPDAAFWRDVFDEDYVSARDVRDAMKRTTGNVTFRINSPGGYVTEAAEIVSLIQERKSKGAKVKTIVDGMAASAAAVIFITGEEREVSEFAQVMVHRSWLGMILVGDAPLIRKESEAAIKQLEGFDNTLAKVMSKIMKDTSVDEALELLDNVTWYNAEEAIEDGIATGKAFAESGSKQEAEASTSREVQAVKDGANALYALFDLDS